MARDYDDREPRALSAEQTRLTFVDRVGMLEEQMERLSSMVARLGEFAENVSRELGIKERGM